MVDTTKEVGKGLLSVYKKYDRIRIGGYIQPQLQVAQAKGIKSFEGGDFGQNVNNRFMLRRGRIRFDYVHFSAETKPSVQFVFQFDGTERGVVIRDFWGRIFENNLKLFSLSTGMFARPFGYEVNLSSRDRESPERGRMSQILMKTERDLGMMVSFEQRERENWLRYIKIDAGIFNGQGLAAPAEYDSYKDFIGKIAVKPLPVSKNLFASAGFSYFRGGFIQNNKYVYSLKDKNNIKEFEVDSNAARNGKELPRHYNGTDAQLKWQINKNNIAEIRGEYWWGRQTSSANNSETPALLLTEPYYIRDFNGAFFYLLYTINKKHQFGLKYDWYDPNTKLSGTQIGSTLNSHTADIRYNTLGFGYTNYIDENLKIVAWYSRVKNESTSLAGFEKDIKDNVFTLRFQYTF